MPCDIPSGSTMSAATCRMAESAAWRAVPANSSNSKKYSIFAFSMASSAADFPALPIVAKRYSMLQPLSCVPSSVSIGNMPNSGTTGFLSQAVTATAAVASRIAVLMRFICRDVLYFV